MPETKPLPIKRGRHEINTYQGDEWVEGWVCGCVGIGHELTLANGQRVYRLTHLPTGMGIASVTGQARAFQAARDLAPLFTLPGAWGEPPPPESYAEARAYVHAMRREAGQLYSE